MKLGPDNGNGGAVIRFGKHLDKGVWLRGWNFRKLWLRWRIRRNLIDLGIVCVHL